MCIRDSVAVIRNDHLEVAGCRVEACQAGDPCASGRARANAREADRGVVLAGVGAGRADALTTAAVRSAGEAASRVILLEHVPGLAFGIQLVGEVRAR